MEPPSGPCHQTNRDHEQVGFFRAEEEQVCDDTLDRIFMAGLPMSDNLVFNEISPIREYTAFAEDIKARWQT